MAVLQERIKSNTFQGSPDRHRPRTVPCSGCSAVQPDWHVAVVVVVTGNGTSFGKRLTFEVTLAVVTGV